MKKRTNISLGLLLLFCGFTFAAKADITYNYVGPYFSAFNGNSNGLTTADRFTGWISLASAATTSYSNNTITAFLLTDGVHTLSSANGDLVDTYYAQQFRADANGDLNAWNFGVAAKGSTFSTIYDPLQTTGGELFWLYSGCNGSNDGVGNVQPCTVVSAYRGVGGAWVSSGSPGTFTAAAAPEPSSALLMIGGAAALVAYRRRKIA